MKLFAGNSNRVLAEGVARYLNIPIGKASVMFDLAPVVRPYFPRLRSTRPSLAQAGAYPGSASTACCRQTSFRSS